MHTYPQLHQRIFALLTEQISPGINLQIGRSGKNLWRVLVLAFLKQGLGSDYAVCKRLRTSAYSYESDEMVFLRIFNRA